MIENTIPEYVWSKWRNSLSWAMAECAYDHAMKFHGSRADLALNLACGSDNSRDNRDDLLELPYGPFLTRFLSYHGIPSVNIDVVNQGGSDLSLPLTRFYKADIYTFNYPALLEDYPGGFDIVFCNNVIENPTIHYRGLMPSRVKDSIEYILQAISPIVVERGIIKIDNQIFRMNSGQIELIYSN